MSFTTQDSSYMARAIQLARKGWFTTRTNPRVGCVLVKDEQIIGEGWHEKPGFAHAEINALNRAGDNARGATAYVTLEPCAHHGKTGPCAEALVEAGVVKVVSAMLDPNPLVSGKGMQILQNAGIEVEHGLMREQAEQLNLGFIKRMTTGLPRVVVKIGMSLDGRTAMASGESQWITGTDARRDVQRLRAESGAVITGSGTVVIDDPSMNVRESAYIANPHFAQPIRVIIDSQNIVEPNAKIFSNEGHCWLVSGHLSEKDYPANVEQKTVALLPGKDKISHHKIDLKALLMLLAETGVNDVLIEAGSGLVGAFIEQEMVDELVVYMAPKLMGSAARPMVQLPLETMQQNIELTLGNIRQIGNDLRLNYYFKKA
ncbi:bifunctional diaminohydroxyphosphoribosylaminopyrimidine deaminase/5-amino-6-(5-phosphoribosylamino)uracil reductase RibD [Kangiella aquimarina]|uniref:Riboflavin biosynthesis protein RibD n=1 Tax=Kangiella aquimarina TaxID=261965 RepID=A0ABZ0X3X8_9GAMM|nr:bifunctional diaminohydroxyphosphoribosylaminopyrimidine deaminase/5-amino-6-(5-phosphoribosylamino)uracil reductase RibD [Kangiella aquimarina]WQG85230.1 bifunctional diaminohydroxyphosphoribosylaminopyrimidine deaminase/5-amino-6-(5-phosphoribosylamino)uracil reductase RibD [Kangiella aquimarina]